jgi:hypothetical protein
MGRCRQETQSSREKRKLTELDSIKDFYVRRFWLLLSLEGNCDMTDMLSASHSNLLYIYIIYIRYIS